MEALQGLVLRPSVVFAFDFFSISPEKRLNLRTTIYWSSQESQTEDRQAHLLEIGAAPRAHGDMQQEGHAVAKFELSLQEITDGAGDLQTVHHLARALGRRACIGLVFPSLM